MYSIVNIFYSTVIYLFQFIYNLSFHLHIFIYLTLMEVSTLRVNKGLQNISICLWAERDLYSATHEYDKGPKFLQSHSHMLYNLYTCTWYYLIKGKLSGTKISKFSASTYDLPRLGLEPKSLMLPWVLYL